MRADQLRQNPLTRLWDEGSQNQEPDWSIILSAMYRTEVPKKADAFWATQHAFERVELVNVTDIDERRVAQALKALREWGLVEKDFVEYDGESLTQYSLTKEGFEVAHEQELSNKSDRINQSLVFFTFVLVLAEIIGIAPVGDIVKSLMVLVILVGMLYMVGRTDIMR